MWDTQAMMGGPGGMSLWQALEPALGAGDGVHLRGAGYDADKYRRYMRQTRVQGKGPTLAEAA